MSVEIGVVTEYTINSFHRIELGTLREYISLLIRFRSQYFNHYPNEVRDVFPRMVVDGSTLDMAEKFVVSLSDGLELGNTIDSVYIEDVLAEFLLGERVSPYRYLLRFLQTGLLAIPSEDIEWVPDGRRSIVRLDLLVNDLELFLERARTANHEKSPEEVLAIAFLQGLLGAAMWCLDKQRVLFCIMRIEKWDGSSIITDRRVGELGFNLFRKVTIESRKELLVRYFSGAAYRVPCNYLKTLLRGAENAQPSETSCQLQRVRIVRGREMFRLTFSDGLVSTLAWDDILMACEPMYEHFGGFTPAGRKLIQTWNEKHGPFRVAPKRCPKGATR